MKDAASLFRAVQRARQLIAAGSHPGAAYEVAARKYSVDIFEVRRLVHRATRHGKKGGTKSRRRETLAKREHE